MSLLAHPETHQETAQIVDDFLIDDARVSPQSSVSEIASIFSSSADFTALPVVDDQTPVGIVKVTDMAVVLAFAQFRHHSDLTAADIMSEHYLTLRAGTKVQSAVEKLNAAVAETVILLGPEGEYKGRLRVLDLVLTEGNQPPAQQQPYVSPLTGLPGQVPIDLRIEQLLEDQSLFVLTQWDINGFKAFNDKYGYPSGDELIRHFSRLLVSESNKQLDFVGHLGGDDFLLLFRSSDWFDRCERIQARFELDVSGFDIKPYPEELKTDSVFAQYSSLMHMALSMGAVQVEPGKFSDYQSVMKALNEVNLRARSTAGGAFFIDEYVNQRFASAGLSQFN